MIAYVTKMNWISEEHFINNGVVLKVGGHLLTSQIPAFTRSAKIKDQYLNIGWGNWTVFGQKNMSKDVQFKELNAYPQYQGCRKSLPPMRMLFRWLQSEPYRSLKNKNTHTHKEHWFGYWWTCAYLKYALFSISTSWSHHVGPADPTILPGPSISSSRTQRHWLFHLLVHKLGCP